MRCRMEWVCARVKWVGALGGVGEHSETMFQPLVLTRLWVPLSIGEFSEPRFDRVAVTCLEQLVGWRGGLECLDRHDLAGLFRRGHIQFGKQGLTDVISWTLC